MNVTRLHHVQLGWVCCVPLCAACVTSSLLLPGCRRLYDTELVQCLLDRNSYWRLLNTTGEYFMWCNCHVIVNYKILIDHYYHWSWIIIISFDDLTKYFEWRRWYIRIVVVFRDCDGMMSIICGCSQECSAARWVWCHCRWCLHSRCGCACSSPASLSPPQRCSSPGFWWVCAGGDYGLTWWCLFGFNLEFYMLF